MWLKNALDEHNLILHGGSNADDSVLDPAVENAIFTTPSYFDRVYKPTELTEFDSILQMDFVSPIDAAENRGGDEETSPPRPRLVSTSEITMDNRHKDASSKDDSSNYHKGYLKENF